MGYVDDLYFQNKNYFHILKIRFHYSIIKDTSNYKFPKPPCYQRRPDPNFIHQSFIGKTNYIKKISHLQKRMDCYKVPCYVKIIIA